MQQILQRARRAWQAGRRAVGVTEQRALERVADIEQRAFGHAPLIQRADLDRGGGRHGDDRDADQQRDKRKAALPGAWNAAANAGECAAASGRRHNESNGRPSCVAPCAPLLRS
ncbi:hypothetical protein [Burkholderia sp. 3C]